MVTLNSLATHALRNGSIKLRVQRSGMYQQLTFKVKRVVLGNIEYTELFTIRQLDMSELTRLAQEVGLPIEAENGKAFPQGTSAQDFQSI